MTGRELEYIQKVFESNYIAPLGEFVNKFEEKLKEYTKAKAALAVSSGTAAIHLALRVLGIQQGDDVLVSTFTFIGSVSPILYQCANPVFIDCDEETWQMSTDLLEEYLKKTSKKPKALIVPHIYGQSADIDKIINICKKYEIFVIEDAAESLGTLYKGKHTGTFGDFGIYSFNGNKIITTGGGGMLVSNNQELIEKARYYSNQAKDPNFIHYEHEDYGYNYRLSNVLAAIGVAQLEVIEEKIEKKRKIFNWYKEYLSEIGEITFMPELPNTRGNRWLTTIIINRDNFKVYDLIKFLDKNNIETRPLWKPMHKQPVFQKYKFFGDGTSERLFSRGICLPSTTSLNKEDIEKISFYILKFLSQTI